MNNNQQTENLTEATFKRNAKKQHKRFLVQRIKNEEKKINKNKLR